MRPSTIVPGSIRPLLLLVALTCALAVGLAACDSGGSSSSDDDTGNGTDVAQTFTVTVESVTDSYTYSDQNNVGVAYAIDGEVGKVITLERGKTYAFELGDGVSPNHPFYVGTTAEGAGGDEFRDDSAKQTTGTVTFTVPSDAPNSLFYVCDVHVYMGGEMDVVDAASSSHGTSDDDDDDGTGGY